MEDVKKQKSQEAIGNPKSQAEDEKITPEQFQSEFSQTLKNIQDTPGVLASKGENFVTGSLKSLGENDQTLLSQGKEIVSKYAKKAKELSGNFSSKLKVLFLLPTVMGTLQGSAQDSHLPEFKNIVPPSSEWRFDTKDSAMAHANSVAFPGFVERYSWQKPGNTKAYEFLGYTDDNEDPIRVPDSIKSDIQKTEAELSHHADPQIDAEKQFEFQKTDAYAKQCIENEYAKNRDHVKEEEFHISLYENNLKTETDTAKQKDMQDMLDYHKKELAKWQYSIESMDKYSSVHYPEIIKENTFTLPELIDKEKFTVKTLQSKLSDLKSEYESVAKYLAAHASPK